MIKLIAGRNGAGKTYSGVKYVREQMKLGRIVFSDTPVFVKHKGEVLSSAILTKSMLKNFQFPEDSVIFINEGDAWFYSRDFKTFTTQDLIIFSQCRHINLDLIVIAKRFSALDLNIRACTDEFVWCTRFPKNDKIPPLFFKHTIYDSEEDFNSIIPKVKPYVKYVFFNRKTASSYDTKYQRHILENRPEKEYVYWSDCEYIPYQNIIQLIKEQIKKHNPFETKKNHL